MNSSRLTIAGNEKRECAIVLPRFCEETLEIRPPIEAIREARDFLAGHFAATRLVGASFLSERVGRRTWLKLEAELPTGWFKVRGLCGRCRRD
jgi:hypothetical protein